MKSSLKLLRDVVTIPTCPFQEDGVAAFLKLFAAKHGITLRRDKAGNLSFVYKKGRCKRPLMLVAHMDHPGIEIKQAAGGRGKAIVMGGLFPACFQKGRPRFDVFSHAESKPVKVTVEKLIGKKRPYSVQISYPKRATLSVGDWGMVSVGSFKNQNGLLKNRVFDDLAQVAAICDTFRYLARTKPNHVHVTGLFTLAEEVGFVGAAAALEVNAPSKSTVILSLECSSALPVGGEQGKGVILRLGDRLSVFSGNVGGFMNHVAVSLQKKTKSFQFQRRLMDGGACEGSLFASAGYATGALALALGNYHNNQKGKFGPETIRLSDYESQLLFLRTLCTEFHGMESWLNSLQPRLTSSYRHWRSRLL